MATGGRQRPSVLITLAVCIKAAFDGEMDEKHYLTVGVHMELTLHLMLVQSELFASPVLTLSLISMVLDANTAEEIHSSYCRSL